MVNNRRGDAPLPFPQFHVPSWGCTCHILLYYTAKRCPRGISHQFLPMLLYSCQDEGSVLGQPYCSRRLQFRIHILIQIQIPIQIQVQCRG